MKKEMKFIIGGVVVLILLWLVIVYQNYGTISTATTTIPPNQNTTKLTGCIVPSNSELPLNQSYVCASVGKTYAFGSGNFVLDNITQRSAGVTIYGTCGGCASPLPTTSNFTLMLNQTTNVYCYTHANLQLVTLYYARESALFKIYQNSELCS